MSLVQDWSLNLLISRPAHYHCTTMDQCSKLPPVRSRQHWQRTDNIKRFTVPWSDTISPSPTISFLAGPGTFQEDLQLSKVAGPLGLYDFNLKVEHCRGCLVLELMISKSSSILVIHVGMPICHSHHRWKSTIIFKMDAIFKYNCSKCDFILFTYSPTYSCALWSQVWAENHRSWLALTVKSKSFMHVLHLKHKQHKHIPRSHYMCCTIRSTAHTLKITAHHLLPIPDRLFIHSYLYFILDSRKTSNFCVLPDKSFHGVKTCKLWRNVIGVTL